MIFMILKIFSSPIVLNYPSSRPTNKILKKIPIVINTVQYLNFVNSQITKAQQWSPIQFQVRNKIEHTKCLIFIVLYISYAFSTTTWPTLYHTKATYVTYRIGVVLLYYIKSKMTSLARWILCLTEEDLGLLMSSVFSCCMYWREEGARKGT
jgi:hypothetical protein